MLNLFVRSVVMIFLVGPLHASGISTHMFMSKNAVEQVSSPELASFLRENKRVFVFASAFPDSGYVEKEIVNTVNRLAPFWPAQDVKELLESLPVVYAPEISAKSMGDENFYGEISHWWPFLKNYRDVIVEQCPGNPAKSCPKIVAHWLGCAAHSIQDEYFDAIFVPQIADKYFNGNRGQATDTTDTGIDMFVLRDHGSPLTGSVESLFPFESLPLVYQKLGVQFNRNDLERGVALLSWVYYFENKVALFARLKYAWSAPWMYANYMTAAGGVNDTASKTAQYIDLLWADLMSGQNSEQDFRHHILATN